MPKSDRRNLKLAPLEFKEVVSDLLKVKPPKKSAAHTKRKMTVRKGVVVGKGGRRN